jgi:hypothetical protein
MPHPSSSAGVWPRGLPGIRQMVEKPLAAFWGPLRMKACLIHGGCFRLSARYTYSPWRSSHNVCNTERPCGDRKRVAPVNWGSHSVDATSTPPPPPPPPDWRTRRPRHPAPITSPRSPRWPPSPRRSSVHTNPPVIQPKPTPSIFQVRFGPHVVSARNPHRLFASSRPVRNSTHRDVKDESGNRLSQPRVELVALVRVKQPLFHAGRPNDGINTRRYALLGKSLIRSTMPAALSHSALRRLRAIRRDTISSWTLRCTACRGARQCKKTATTRGVLNRPAMELVLPLPADAERKASDTHAWPASQGQYPV